MDILWKTSSLSSACRYAARIEQANPHPPGIIHPVQVKPHGKAASRSSPR
jgi:hypothetical protein